MKRFRRWVQGIFRKPETFFIATGGLFGLALLLITPPFQTPDEQGHFLRVYQLSQFHIVSGDNKGVPGDYLPASLSKTIELVNSPPIEFQPERKYDLHDTKVALKVNLNKDKTAFTNIASTSAYSPIGYIPQSILVGLASLFNMPPILLVYIARLGALCAWLGLIFVAIRILPYRKWTVAGLALLPMLIAQAGSPGIDAVSIGLGVLFIASVLRLQHISLIPRKWWILLLVLASLIALTKQTTVLVLGFIFLLRTSSFDTVRVKAVLKKASILFIPALLLVLWSAVTSILHLTSGSGVPGQDVYGQLTNIVHNPFRIPQVIFNTFFLTWGDNVITSFIGNFGWMDTPLAGGIIAIGYIYLSYLLLRSYELQPSVRERKSLILPILMIALYTLGTMTALYILYSPVNFDILYGLQGRYFLLALFMALPLGIFLKQTTDERTYAKVTIISASVLALCTLVTVFLRFYVRLF